MNTNKTSLDWISDLALRLATIAHDPETWESYKVADADTKGIVIDRTENNLSVYVRQCEAFLSTLYDADYQKDVENEKLQAQLDAAAEVLQDFAQFANDPSVMARMDSDYVTIRVRAYSIKEARRLLGGSFRDYSSTEDIPV